jgi:hypothetical protein
VLVKHPAGIGAEHTLGVTVQQLHAQLVFELTQLLGQRRLRHVQYQGRARQRAVVDDGNEIAYW